MNLEKELTNKQKIFCLVKKYMDILHKDDRYLLIPTNLDYGQKINECEEK